MIAQFGTLYCVVSPQHPCWLRGD